MKSVPRSTLDHDFGVPITFDDWKAQEFGWQKPIKPRRRTLRQADPVRVQCYLDRDITIGEPSRSWWQAWRNTIALTLFAAALIVGAYVFSGGIALP